MERPFPFISLEQMFLRHLLSTSQEVPQNFTPTAYSNGQLRNRLLHQPSLASYLTPCGRLSYWFQFFTPLQQFCISTSTLVLIAGRLSFPHFDFQLAHVTWFGQWDIGDRNTSRSLKYSLLCSAIPMRKNIPIYLFPFQLGSQNETHEAELSQLAPNDPKICEKKYMLVAVCHSSSVVVKML